MPKGFIEISDGYERSWVNITYIIRIEKLDKSENSAIMVHLY